MALAALLFCYCPMQYIYSANPVTSGQCTPCILSLCPKSRKDLTARVQEHAAGIINIVQLPEPEDMTAAFFISKRGQLSKKIMNFLIVLGDSPFSLSWDISTDNCRHTHRIQIKHQDIY